MKLLQACFATAVMLVASIAWSQDLPASIAKKKALLGVTNPVTIGTRQFVGEDSNPSVTDVVLLNLDPSWKFQLVKAKRDGQKISGETLVDKQTFLYAGAGTYSLDVTLFDAEKGIFNNEFEFVLGGSAPEPDKPKPDPVNPSLPGDEWDNVAQRLDAACKHISQGRRDILAAMFLDAHVEMELFQVLKVSEAAARVSAKLSPFEAEFGAAMKIIRQQSAAREFSFDEAMRFYGAVADGVAGKIVSR